MPPQQPQPPFSPPPERPAQGGPVPQPPAQPLPGVTPSATGQPANYDFIFGDNQPPKSGSLKTSSSLPLRLLLIVGGIFLIVIVLAVLLKLVNGSSGGLNKPAMLSVVQDQVEIQHLTIAGTQNSTTDSNKNFSVTAQLTLKSDQAVLTNYLSSKGYKPNAKVLNAKQSAATDTTLTNAQSSSTFDTTYATVMQQELQTYQKDLSSAYKGAPSSAQSVLSVQYNNASLLLTQLTGQTSNN